ncbi:MAG: FKBP-type peptidyl-prolyl cis-trans isomerase [Candidatus Methanomethylophilaceae archaeon]
MAAKKGQKKKGQADGAKAVEPVDDVEKDTDVVLTKASGDAGSKREKAKNRDRNGSGFIAFCRKADPIAMSCFVVIMLACVVILGSYVNAMYINPQWDSPVAVEGDTVKVEYVGSYNTYYDRDGAVIFDTNVKSVNDGSEYLKSPSYTNKTSFSYLSFKVGDGTVLPGFSDAVVGKLINWTALVAIPADEGYGLAEKYDFELTQDFKFTGTMTLEAFNTLASTSLKASDLTVGYEVTMPNGLTAIVNKSGIDSVTYQYVYSEVEELKNNETVKVTKIDDNVSIKVTAINGSEFTIQYIFSSANKMYETVIPYEDAEKIVFVDNFTDGQYKYKIADGSSNQEQKGEVLYFWIKIVDINGYAGV